MLETAMVAGAQPERRVWKALSVKVITGPPRALRAPSRSPTESSRFGTRPSARSRSPWREALHARRRVVFKLTREGPRYLLVEASGRRGRWVFPKGHVEEEKLPPLPQRARSPKKRACAHGPVKRLRRVVQKQRGSRSPSRISS